MSQVMSQCKVKIEVRVRVIVHLHLYNSLLMITMLLIFFLGYE